MNDFPKPFIFTLLGLALISTLTLYSAASGHIFPWAYKQMMCYLFGFLCLYGLSKLDVHIFYDYAYIFYFIALILLLCTSVLGHIGMGAKRWINLGIFNIQPSELMRVALIIVLARYFTDYGHEIKRTIYLLIPILIVLLPIGIIIKQPDLGTSILILGTSGVIAFIAGVQWWKFGLALGSLSISIPFLWHYLHEYQRNRILIFLNPESDPQNAGYHIMQSKIAIGSGGLWGTGYLKGPQSHLNFLPEKHTDFIFTMFFEEWGLLASSLLMLLYLYLIFYGYHIALNSKSRFHQLLAISISTALFFYVGVNLSMVVGLLPVVGIPLPFISYGRTSLISLMITQGILMAIYRYNHQKVRHFS